MILLAKSQILFLSEFKKKSKCCQLTAAMRLGLLSFQIAFFGTRKLLVPILIFNFFFFSIFFLFLIHSRTRNINCRGSGSRPS